MNSPIFSIACSPSGAQRKYAWKTCIMPSQTSNVTFTPAALAFSENRVESSSNNSVLPTCIKSGGKPLRSAYNGEIYGFLGSSSPTYKSDAKKIPLASIIGSIFLLVLIESPVISKSVHGESNTAAAGKAIPKSLNFISVAPVKPPPAESPEITIFFGSIP